MSVVAFARAGVQHPRTRWKGSARIRLRRLRSRFRNAGRSGGAARAPASRDLIVDHDFLRASTMMVEPARQAASSSVKGSEAPTRPTYSRSFNRRWREFPRHAAAAAPWDRARARGWSPCPPDCRAAKNACGAALRSRSGSSRRFDVGETEIDQVAGDVDAVPALAQQQKLPARGIGNLEDQAAVGRAAARCAASR